MAHSSAGKMSERDYLRPDYLLSEDFIGFLGRRSNGAAQDEIGQAGNDPSPSQPVGSGSPALPPSSQESSQAPAAVPVTGPAIGQEPAPQEQQPLPEPEDPSPVADPPSGGVDWSSKNISTISGVDCEGGLGRYVGSAGDINGDGYDDVVVVSKAVPDYSYGSWDSFSYAFHPLATAKDAFILYGGENGIGDIDLDGLSPAKGFRIDIKNIEMLHLGDVISYKPLLSIHPIGDVNQDGIDDLLIDAGTYSNEIGLSSPGGESVWLTDSYVIYGRVGGYGFVDVHSLTPDQGYRVTLPLDFDQPTPDIALPISEPQATEAEIGDVNGDGIVDHLFLSSSAQNGAGAVYLVYGGNGAVNLEDLQPDQGFEIVGLAPGDGFGHSAGAAGDLNGDGYADIVIGAPGAGKTGWQPYMTKGNAFLIELWKSGDPFFSEVDPNYLPHPLGLQYRSWTTGESYILYGGDFSGAVSLAGTSGSDVLAGTPGSDSIVAGQGADSIAGSGGADSVHAGAGDDRISLGDLSFRLADGGGGADTLHFDFAGAVALDPARIHDIEALDLGNGFANDLSLRVADVLALDVRHRDLGGDPALDNVLVIDGEAGDTLHLLAGDGWTAWPAGGPAGYALYAVGPARIAVDQDIAAILD